MDRVLVEKITPPTKSVGGVLLPETMTGKQVRTDDDDDGREGGFFSLSIDCIELNACVRACVATIDALRKRERVTDEDNGRFCFLLIYRRTRRWWWPSVPDEEP